MTKEIALLAPPEEPEEPEEPEHPKPQLIQETSQTRVDNLDQVPAKAGKMTDITVKKSQPKPQREKPPRFDRGAKRRPTSGKDETKKEHSGGFKGRKNCRDTSVFQKSPNKGDTVGLILLLKMFNMAITLVFRDAKLLDLVLLYTFCIQITSCAYDFCSGIKKYRIKTRTSEFSDALQ